jgi:diacylglycerol kinase (ATP)
VLEPAVRALKHAGHDIEMAATTGPGSATEIARRSIDRGADLILVAGGDGTINEAVNGMADSNVPLGILPCGTANVLAMELGVGRNIVKAAEKLGECVPERIALGLLHSATEPGPRYFLMMCGIGLDAHIVYHLSASLKAALGKISYWVGGFSQLGRRLPEFEVEIDGRINHASFALVSRVRNYGGDLEIAPNISLLEDDCELVLFSGRSALRYLKYMAGVVTGRLDGMRGVAIVRAREARFSAPEDSRIYIQVDGEYAGRLPAKIEVACGALTLLTPPEFRAKRSLNAADPAWTTSPTR